MASKNKKIFSFQPPRKLRIFAETFWGSPSLWKQNLDILGEFYGLGKQSGKKDEDTSLSPGSTSPAPGPNSLKKSLIVVIESGAKLSFSRMTIANKKDALLKELSAIKNSQERFTFVIAQARQSPALDVAFKTDAFRVEGCLAKLWLVTEYRDRKCFFQTDSDSAIVKGIATVLCRFYSDCLPVDILSIDPSFLEAAGITQHLTPNRRNSLSRIWEEIRGFAIEHLGDRNQFPVISEQ